MTMMLVYYRKNKGEYVSEMVSCATDVFITLETNYYQRKGKADIDRYCLYRIKSANEFEKVDCTYVPGKALIITEKGWTIDSFILAEVER